MAEAAATDPALDNVIDFNWTYQQIIIWSGGIDRRNFNTKFSLKVWGNQVHHWEINLQKPFRYAIHLNNTREITFDFTVMTHRELWVSATEGGVVETKLLAKW